GELSGRNGRLEELLASLGLTVLWSRWRSRIIPRCGWNWTSGRKPLWHIWGGSSMVLFDKKSACFGCGACGAACAAGAITMAVDAEGFAYPVINPEVCVNCGACAAACPVGCIQ
ncbi:MAG: 4Fe-4S dicluster domain-containing protein, partial [Clostridia bacterium]|nr:4Fe-4S dicluster domain-containing protein [Clostridia bacterium]